MAGGGVRSRRSRRRLARSRASVLLADAVYEGRERRAEQRPAGLGGHDPAIPPRSGHRGRPASCCRRSRRCSTAATLLGHNYLPLDPDGPARRMPPFVREGERYHAVARRRPRRCWRAASGRRKWSSRSGEFGRWRSPHAARRRRRSTIADEPARPTQQLTTLINYRAPAPGRTAARPTRPTKSRHLLASEEQLRRDQKPLRRSRGLQGQDRLRRPDRVGPGRRVPDAVRRDNGNMPGIQLHATMADSMLSNRFIRAGVARRADCRDHARRGLLVGLLAAAAVHAGGRRRRCSRWPAGPGSRWPSFKGGLWLNMAQPLTAMAVALFAGTAYQYFVEGPREARRQAAVRPLRVAGRLPAAARPPGAGRAGRRAARHDGPVLGHPRLHQRDREGPAGGAGRAAERVLLAHGRDRVPAPRHGRQVRRRHGDGAVRRAGGRSGSCGARGGGRRGDGRASSGELNRKWAREGQVPRSTSASASIPAT